MIDKQKTSLNESKAASEDIATYEDVFLLLKAYVALRQAFETLKVE